LDTTKRDTPQEYEAEIAAFIRAKGAGTTPAEYIPALVTLYYPMYPD
jgi:hypothetical protein